MVIIQLAIVALLLVAAVLRGRGPGAGEWVRDAPLIAVAAWIGEESCIVLYDFYLYAPGWTAKLHHVPPLIPIIWMFVVLSARDVARALDPRRVLLLGFALVLYDAWLIEPVATHAGLWVWLYPKGRPGPFHVPLIGPLGWAFFAISALFCLERLKGRARLLTIVLAPLATHAMLLAAWWGALRWIGRGPSNLTWTAVGCSIAVALTVALGVTGRLQRVPLWVMAPRIGPALFFFWMLAVGGWEPMLYVYAAAFALPWLAATDWSWHGRGVPRAAQ